MNARAGYIVALVAAVVLYMLSKTEKGQAVVASAADAVASTVRGLRNNNPGNLRENAFRGYVGLNDGYAVFDTMQNGVRASVRQLKLYIQRGNNTLAGIISTWAPAADSNNTAAYIAAMAKSTGFLASQVLAANEATLFLLARGIFRHELGAVPAATITDAMVRQGIADA